MERSGADVDGSAATTLADVAEQRLRDDIIAGRLAPTRRLRMEDLKARYAVGASPLREALSRLTGEGLVVLEGNKGFSVRGLSKEDLDDIATMRTAIECTAVRIAIERGDDAWEAGILASLHRLVRASERTLTDPVSLGAWNAVHDDFHRALIVACGSPRLLEQQRRLAQQHARYRLYLMGDNIPRGLLIQEHRDLAEVVLARDAAAAECALKQHLRITSDFYAKVLDEAADRKPDRDSTRRKGGERP